MSLLTVVQAACAEVGIAQPSTVVANTDMQIVQFLALANREGSELSKACEWVQLQRPNVFTTTANVSEYSLPADFDHLNIETVWDRSNFRPIDGPLTPQDWQAIKSGVIGAGLVFSRYRVYRSATTSSTVFTVDPTPTTSGDTFVFEYLSSYWCATANGATPKPKFTLDTDIFLLSENLLVMGVIWRYLRAKGLPYNTQLLEYQQAVDREAGRNRPAPTLSLTGRLNQTMRLLGPWSVPDTGIGS